MGAKSRNAGKTKTRVRTCYKEAHITIDEEVVRQTGLKKVRVPSMGGHHYLKGSTLANFIKVRGQDNTDDLKNIKKYTGKKRSKGDQPHTNNVIF